MNRIIAAVRDSWDADIPEEAATGQVVLPSGESPAKKVSSRLDRFFQDKALATGGSYSSDWNRASQMGDACDRRLVYMRTCNEAQEAFAPWVMQILEDGSAQERLWKGRLMEAGFDIEHAQQKLVWPEYKIRGHIDGVLVHPDGDRVCFELKRLNANAASRIRRWQDFVSTSFYRHYPAQLALYLLMRGETDGVFIITYEGHFKVLDFSLDDPECLDYAEKALQQAERVNAHVEAGTMPERIADLGVCATCRYSATCLPDLPAAVETECQEIDDPTIKGILDRRGDLEPDAKEFGKLDKQVKALMRGRPHVRCGDWEIKGKTITTRRLDTKALPEAIKAQFLMESEYWRCQIRRSDTDVT